MDMTKYQIKQLEGKANWLNWKGRVSILLRGSSDALDVVEGRLRKPDEPSDGATEAQTTTQLVEESNNSISAFDVFSAQTQSNSANMDVVNKVEVKDHCVQALAEVGAPAEFCNFYADILQCEYDMTHTIYRMQKELRDELSKNPLDSAVLFAVIQNMTKKFYVWKTSVESLAERGSQMPPLQLNPNRLAQSQVLKALCSLETKEMNLEEGEQLIVTDTTQPNRIGVRNAKGVEGYVPALCCLLPTPDNNAMTAVERIQVHLLTSWTECVRMVKSQLFDNLLTICKSQTNAWNDLRCGGGGGAMSNAREGDRVGRRFRRLLDSATVQSNGIDLTRLHRALFSLEKELVTLRSNYLTDMIGTVSNLDKAVLCFQSFHKQWKNFQKSLKEAARPIRLVPHLDQLRQIAHGQNFKYYEMKMTLEDTEVMEEITYVNHKTGERYRQVLRGGSASKHEAVSAEQLTSSSQEEKRRFIIQSVVDPRDLGEISMRDAMAAGVVDPDRGLYVNPSTGEGKPIAVAMTEGLIRVEYVSTRKTVEKTRAVGLITIRSRIDRRGYTVTGAVDAATAERVDAAEAQRRGLIDQERGSYRIGTTGESIDLLDAIDQGWVTADFEEEDSGGRPMETEEVNTYAVSEVIDPVLGTKMAFADALARGVIDRETGDYVDRSTRETLTVVEAIRQGRVRARLVEDAAGLNISSANAVVVDRIQRIKKNVLKGLRVVNAFKSSTAAAVKD